eukprot:g30083.t1
MMEEPSTSVQEIRLKLLWQSSQKYQVDDPSRPPPVVPSITDTSLQPSGFSPRGIKKQLEALDTVKPMGPDNIMVIVLKTCAPELAAPLAKLFQYS